MNHLMPPTLARRCAQSPYPSKRRGKIVLFPARLKLYSPPIKKTLVTSIECAGVCSNAHKLEGLRSMGLFYRREISPFPSALRSGADFGKLIAEETRSGPRSSSSLALSRTERPLARRRTGPQNGSPTHIRPEFRRRCDG